MRDQTSYRALTVWQPWASLIMEGFKPFEFRGWDFAAWPALRALIGQRIVIHAASRKLDPYWPVRLQRTGACAELRGTCHGGDPDGANIWLCDHIHTLAFGAGLGTVVLGAPVPPRTSAHNWSWPVSEPRPFVQPIYCRGALGFWVWNPCGDLYPAEEAAGDVKEASHADGR